jgi:hypothetical protein
MIDVNAYARSHADDEDDDLSSAAESTIIAACNMMMREQSGAIFITEVHRAQIRNLALSSLQLDQPYLLALNGYRPGYHAVSESDRWHFFEQQLQTTSASADLMNSPFSREDVELMLNNFLVKARDQWDIEYLQHIFVCREFSWDKLEYGGIQHRHSNLIAYIDSHSHLRIAIPNHYRSCSEDYTPFDI